MHKGVFVGACADRQSIKILILGESHHWDKADWITAHGETEAEAAQRRNKKAQAYETKAVVRRYIENYAKPGDRDKAYRFFEYIVRTFGMDPEQQREHFWSRVYFGNYVEELCGVRDSKAKEAIKKRADQYNRSLFRFIQDNGIDCVFCFSRRVYAALPQLEKHDSQNRADGMDAHRLEKCVYGAGAREHMNMELQKAVTFYGLRHTSQGFSYRKYQERISQIRKEIGF